MKNFLIAFFSVISSILGYSQDLHWTSIHDLEDSMAVQAKPILVKIETEWCGYCKLMDKKVYPSKKVVKELNANYYYVKLDAEKNEPITLDGVTYIYIINFGRKGIHQLAKKWATNEGQVSQIKYPTTIVLDENYKIQKFLDGYLPKQNFIYWLQE